MFRQFVFSVIVDMVEFIFTSMLFFSVYSICFSSLFPLFLASIGLTDFFNYSIYLHHWLTRFVPDLFVVTLGFTLCILNRKWKWKWKWSHIWLFVTPWAVAHQAPPSMGFPRQGYWSGLLFPSPGDLPDPGIEPMSPTLQADKGRWRQTL